MTTPKCEYVTPVLSQLVVWNEGLKEGSQHHIWRFGESWLISIILLRCYMGGGIIRKIYLPAS